MLSTREGFVNSQGHFSASAKARHMTARLRNALLAAVSIVYLLTSIFYNRILQQLNPVLPLVRHSFGNRPE